MGLTNEEQNGLSDKLIGYKRRSWRIGKVYDKEHRVWVFSVEYKKYKLCVPVWKHALTDDMSIDFKKFVEMNHPGVNIEPYRYRFSDTDYLMFTDEKTASVFVDFYEEYIREKLEIAYNMTHTKYKYI